MCIYTYVLPFIHIHTCIDICICTDMCVLHVAWAHEFPMPHSSPPQAIATYALASEEEGHFGDASASDDVSGSKL